MAPDQSGAVHGVLQCLAFRQDSASGNATVWLDPRAGRRIGTGAPLRGRSTGAGDRSLMGQRPCRARRARIIEGKGLESRGPVGAGG
jgi:hypothetical protein